jgi:hypothetical protein
VNVALCIKGSVVTTVLPSTLMGLDATDPHRLSITTAGYGRDGAMLGLWMEYKMQANRTRLANSFIQQLVATLLLNADFLPFKSPYPSPTYPNTPPPPPRPTPMHHPSPSSFQPPTRSAFYQTANEL